jgi:hypothetical protein
MPQRHFSYNVTKQFGRGVRVEGGTETPPSQRHDETAAFTVGDTEYHIYLQSPKPLDDATSAAALVQIKKLLNSN